MTTRKSAAAPETKVRTGTQLFAASLDALRKAGSVRIRGTLPTDDGQRATTDMHLLTDSAVITQTFSGGTTEIRLVDGETFVNGPAAFWRLMTIPAPAAGKLAGRWVILPGTKNGWNTLTQFIDATSGANHIQPKVRAGSFDGRKVLIISQDGGSTIYVAATGAPLPVRLNDVRGHKILTFSEYGVQKPVAAPENAELARTVANG